MRLLRKILRKPQNMLTLLHERNKNKKEVNKIAKKKKTNWWGKTKKYAKATGRGLATAGKVTMRGAQRLDRMIDGKGSFQERWTGKRNYRKKNYTNNNPQQRSYEYLKRYGWKYEGKKETSHGPSIRCRKGNKTAHVMEDGYIHYNPTYY